MCQIFAGKAAKIRDILLNKPGVLDSLFKRNHDGLGAMYATSKHVLKMPKVVPGTIEEARAFIAQLPNDDRNLVIHFRMKTSGKIDHDNAHPFVVLDDTMGMTHNGVLKISTQSDQTKCDTRHYIERYLQPMLKVSPQMARVPEWLEIVGNDIGSNRFVFMDNTGFISYVNHHTGYEFEGIWFANTYSFDAGLIDDQFKPKTYTTGTWKGGSYYTTGLGDTMFDDDWSYGNVKPLKPKKEKVPLETAKKRAGIAAAFDAADDRKVKIAAANQKLLSARFGTADKEHLTQVADDIWAAIKASDAPVMEDYLREMPITTLYTLFSSCDYIPVRAADSVNYGEMDEKFIKALADHDMNAVLALVGGVHSRYAKLSEAICWYGDWVGKAPETEDHVAVANEMVEAARNAVAELEQALVELDADEDETHAKLTLATTPSTVARLKGEIDEIELERGVIQNELELAKETLDDAEAEAALGAIETDAEMIERLGKMVDAAKLSETTQQVVEEQQVAV